MQLIFLLSPNKFDPHIEINLSFLHVFARCLFKKFWNDSEATNYINRMKTQISATRRILMLGKMVKSHIDDRDARFPEL